jgi:hypothetical protein
MGYLTVQFQKQMNQMLNEAIVVPRLVNTQTVDFNDWCARMANGSTVTAADVAAVMQQIEDKLPEILTLNAKVICSPGGLVFRPSVHGSIKQSELKAKLEAKKAAEEDPEKAAKIDVNRALVTSDLSISDCSLSIEVDLPKTWSTSFNQRATLKRVSKADTNDANTTNPAIGNSDGPDPNNTQSGNETGGGNTSGGTTTGDEPGEDRP